MQAYEDLSTSYHTDPSGAAGHSLLESNQAYKWKQIVYENGPRPGPRSGAASVVYEDSLYIFGGYGGNGRLDDLWEYNFLEKQWHRLDTHGTAPPGRENNGAVLYKGGMYIFGGYSGCFWLNDFHRLDLRKDYIDSLTWTAVIAKEGSPPSTRFGYVSAAWKDTFLVFGGYDGSNWLNDMHEFNFIKLKWTKLDIKGVSPSVRSCPSWVSYGKSVYLFGGYDGVHRMNDFYEFDLEEKTWKPVQFTGPSPSPRYFHSSVVYGDSMYLFGGYNGIERLQDLYQFDFNKKRWSCLVVEDPPTGRSSLVAQVYSHSMFAFGGYNGNWVLNDFYEFQFEMVAIPPSSFFSDIKNMINHPKFSDVTFIVEDKEIKANKSFLAARSEHFNALFFGGMREQTDSLVHIDDVQYEVFEEILHYLHTDTISPISVDMCVAVMVAAERFMIDRLKALCQDNIRKNITMDNVVPILRVAYYHRANSLKEICMDYICLNFKEVKRYTSFQELEAEPHLMMELLMRL